MTVSPCISICKMDPITGYCYGCGRSTEEKIKWKAETTTEEWKQENIKIIVSRLDGWQLKSFKDCLLYTSPSPRDEQSSRMPSSA